MDDEEVANFHWHYNILNTDVEALLFKAGQHMSCVWLNYVNQGDAIRVAETDKRGNGRRRSRELPLALQHTKYRR